MCFVILRPRGQARAPGPREPSRLDVSARRLRPLARRLVTPAPRSARPQAKSLSAFVLVRSERPVLNALPQARTAIFTERRSAFPEPRRQSRRFFVLFPDSRRTSLAAISVTGRRSVTVACQWRLRPVSSRQCSDRSVGPKWPARGTRFSPLCTTPAVRLDHERLCVNRSRQLSVLHRTGLITRSVKVRATTARALVAAFCRRGECHGHLPRWFRIPSLLALQSARFRRRRHNPYGKRISPAGQASLLAAAAKVPLQILPASRVLRCAPAARMLAVPASPFAVSEREPTQERSCGNLNPSKEISHGYHPRYFHQARQRRLHRYVEDPQRRRIAHDPPGR